MKIDFFETNINPFLIDVEDKTEYTIEDYIEIQKKLCDKSVELDEFLDTLYPEENITTPLVEIKRRCKKGINAKIIDIDNPILPEKKLYMIGNGGDNKNCFVCCTALFDTRHDASQNILESLVSVGFNGHFLLLNGGFPNPTGSELKYSGIPYNFKIYMILEAKNLGFEKVIWIDSVCYAVNNPDKLFEMLDDGTDSVFNMIPSDCFQQDTYKNICFPKTLDLLSKLVNRDVKHDITINSIVFGLNLKSQKMLQFIDEYNEMVKLGLPFLTSFPEEIIFATILNKPEYIYVFNNKEHMRKLYIHEYYLNKEGAKDCGYYFLQREFNTSST